MYYYREKCFLKQESIQSDMFILFLGDSEKTTQTQVKRVKREVLRSSKKKKINLCFFS